jgi:hypothetical protein
MLIPSFRLSREDGDGQAIQHGFAPTGGCSDRRWVPLAAAGGQGAKTVPRNLKLNFGDLAQKLIDEQRNMWLVGRKRLAGSFVGDQPDDRRA